MGLRVGGVSIKLSKDVTLSAKKKEIKITKLKGVQWEKTPSLEALKNKIYSCKKTALKHERFVLFEKIYFQHVILLRYRCQCFIQRRLHHRLK